MSAEFVDFEAQVSIEEIEESESEIPNIHYDIASYPSDFTLAGLVGMFNDGDIEIPDYQREFVWTIKQASLLIDSFLSGLPVPAVFFYIDENNKNLVIDGQQRVLSIAYFFSGFFGPENQQGTKKVFRLTGLPDTSPYYNKTFVELPGADQRKLKQAVLRAVNIRQLSPVGDSTSAFHIFERLNTGGTPLKPQEIRNCVFRGTFNQLIKNLNEDRNWRLILGNPLKDKHQRDIEFILRVYALFESHSTYEKPMKQFLNRAMQKNATHLTEKASFFCEHFSVITEYIVKTIGEKPFHLRGPLNVAALDAVLCVLMENHSRLNQIDLEQVYSKLRGDEQFEEYTKVNTTDSKSVKNRIELVKKEMSVLV